jgi:hypothetical protein
MIAAVGLEVARGRCSAKVISDLRMVILSMIWVV